MSYNPCGDCNACCSRYVMPEIHWMGDGAKPKNTLCDKWCEGSCTIYEERPKACADFICLWLRINTARNGNFSTDMRPDNTNVMVSAKQEDGVGVVCLEEMKPNSFDIMNMTPNQENLVREIINILSKQTVPTELYSRKYDWTMLKVNIGKENNDDDLQQD